MFRNPLMVSRRTFLKAMAYYGAMVILNRLLPELIRGAGSAPAAGWTSWGQADITFAELNQPYQSLADWHILYLSLILRNMLRD